MPRFSSPLELLHPDGAPKVATVLGRGCPPRLAPTRLFENADRFDLVIVAPSAAELRDRGWLEQAVRSAADRLNPDGVAYVLVPRRLRREAVGALARRGLSSRTGFAHLPSWAETRYLVPLVPAAAAYAFSSLVRVRRWRRGSALAALALPQGAGLLARALPMAGLAAQRAAARPLAQWLYRLDDSNAVGAPPVVIASWRPDGASFVLHRFVRDEPLPTGVVKVRSGGSLVREVEALRSLGPAARGAGATVPDPLLVDPAESASLVLETVAPGRSAAVLLGDAPQQLDEVHERLARWLGDWNEATAVTRPLTEARLAEELLEPAQLLAPLLNDGDDYLSRLEGRCVRVRGSAMPFVATHNDLTMSNVFISDEGPLGVVDWEAGRYDGFPLVDFFYSAADAAAARRRYRDRMQAFLECFAAGGRHQASVISHSSSLARALGLSSTLAELCFHACWLHHAANEHRSSPEEGPLPFLEILQWVASERGRDEA